MEIDACGLCHEQFIPGERVYHYARNNGVLDSFHMICFCEETVQGRAGYKPTEITHYGEQLDLFQKRNHVE